jgi:hypothetical protein
MPNKHAKEKIRQKIFSMQAISPKSTFSPSEIYEKLPGLSYKTISRNLKELIDARGPEIKRLRLGEYVVSSIYKGESDEDYSLSLVKESEDKIMEILKVTGGLKKYSEFIQKRNKKREKQMTDVDDFFMPGPQKPFTRYWRD